MPMLNQLIQLPVDIRACRETRKFSKNIQKDKKERPMPEQPVLLVYWNPAKRVADPTIMGQSWKVQL